MLIQRLRDGTQGVIAKVIVGLIILVFGLFGFGSITTFLAPPAEVASVNGAPITQREMEVAVERNRRMILADEEASPADIDEDRLRADVLNSLISRLLLTQQVDQLGLHYGDAAIDAEIVATPAFQLEGRFDAEQFKLALSSAGYTPMMYRDELRVSSRIQQLVAGIADSQFVTQDEVRRLDRLRLQTRDLAYLHLDVEALLAEVEASDGEVEAHYQQNLGQFVTEESLAIEYLELLRDDLAADLQVTEADLLAQYEDTKQDYAVEEARRISHILVAAAEGAGQEAAALRERLLAGEDFATLAEAHSDDPGSAEQGGDLGFNTRGAFVPEFEAAAFSLPVGQVSEPVQTEFGHHLIKVTEIEEGSTPSLDEIREEVEAAYRNSLADEDFLNLSAQLGDLLFESSDLALPAAEAGLEVKAASGFKRTGNEGVLADPQVISAAFSDYVLKDGNNSDIIELSDIHHLALRVVSHSPAEQRALDEVREEAKEQLLRQKAIEESAKRAAAILSDLRDGLDAGELASRHGFAWQRHEGAGRDLANPQPDALSDEGWVRLLGAAFGLPRPAEGKESIGGARLPTGASVVLRVSNVMDGEALDMAEDEAAAIAGLMATQLGEADLLEVRQALVESASIVRE